VNSSSPWLLAIVAVTLLASCAGQRRAVEVSPLSEEISQTIAPDSLKIDLTLIWKKESVAGSVEATLFHKPQKFSRIEIRGPMGVTLASILCEGQGWRVWVPSEERLFTGEGEVIPEPLTFGMGEVNLDEWIAQATSLKKGERVRIEKNGGWIEFTLRSLEENPSWGKWVRQIDLPEKYLEILWRDGSFHRP